MKKISFIRSDKKDKEQRCPFGLPITEACHCAGSSVANMCPLDIIEEEEKQAKVKKANSRVYLYYKDDTRCLYADNIIDKLGVVNCDFGDTGQGMHMPAFTGSPIYPQAFSGVSGGVSAFPLGFYADNNESRNLFQGLFSLVGNKSYEIIKKAILEDSRLLNIVCKLENGEELTKEEKEKIKIVIGG